MHRLITVVSVIYTGFYHQCLDDGRLIDFGLLLQEDVYGDAYELEMGKVLYMARNLVSLVDFIAFVRP